MATMNANRFKTGRSFAEYATNSKVAGEALRSNYSATVISPETAARFAGFVHHAGGFLYAVVVSEEWCPDCQDNLPVLARLADTVPGMTLRVFGRDASPELVQAYSVEGKFRIPTAVFYDSEWNELGRWIERPAKATELLEKAEAEVRRAVREQYRTELRGETLREVTDLLARRLGDG
ncbi:MAG: thioredoxin family protein [Bacillota bacterium]